MTKPAAYMACCPGAPDRHRSTCSNQNLLLPEKPKRARVRRRTPLALTIIASRAIPGMLSLRPSESPDAASGTDLRRALAAAGYEPGDEVDLRPRRALREVSRG